MGEIYIGGEWDYRLKMYGIYGTVAGNPAGAAIIDLVKKTKRDLNFVPRNAKDVFNSGKCNAETVAKKLRNEIKHRREQGPALRRCTGATKTTPPPLRMSVMTSSRLA